MRITREQIEALAEAIAEAQGSTRPADMLLHQFFRAHQELGARDRSVVAEGLFAWLRRRRSLEAMAGATHPRLLALAVLVRDMGHSVRELEPLLGDRDVAWLQEFKGRPADVNPAVTHDVPDWLWDRLGAVAGEAERSAMTRSWMQPAPLDIRINPLQAKREAIQAELAAAGIESQVTPYSPLGLRIAGRPALNRLPAFSRGDIEVQDEGSQLLGILVQPKRNEMVVDFCAGAGGKTLLLGALMRNQGRLYAFDTSEKRLANLRPRLKRSGLSNIHPQLIAHENDARIKRLTGKIDTVLIDAPCSGLGTLRRNPDLKWKQTPESVAELQLKQKAILASASRLAKPGGRVIYATCSMLPEENEDVVNDFIGEHPDYRLVPASEVIGKLGWDLETGDFLRLSPHRHGCDAFFAAVLERKSEAAKPKVVPERLTKPVIIKGDFNDKPL
ncbi:MAG: RsmB/NOP family class I SAM-dependent RNA methyltransferase [Casimicrobiaceae bacterium]